MFLNNYLFIRPVFHLAHDCLILSRKIKTHRGVRAGVRAKCNKQKFRHSMPCLILSNVQSIKSKTNLLQINCNELTEYRQSDLMCFIETWLEPTFHNSLLHIDGFSVARSDRDKKSSKKQLGGGLILYINDKYCNNFQIVQTYCHPNVEFMIVNLRPFYLPREFSNIFVFVLYIPERKKLAEVKEIIENHVTDLSRKKPDALFLRFYQILFNTLISPQEEMPHSSMFIAT